MKKNFASALVIAVFLSGSWSMDPQNMRRIRLRRQSDRNTIDDLVAKGFFGDKDSVESPDNASGPTHFTPRPKFPTAYALPSGSELIVGLIKQTFSCFGLIYGYYADVDNNCQIFHVCAPYENLETGFEEMVQYSFFCGNQTIFDQETLTCTYVDDALPCSQAAFKAYEVNKKFGMTDRPT